MISSSYLTPTFCGNYRNQILKFFHEMVSHVDFDAVVLTGVSGTLMGGVLAHFENKGIIVVRKDEEFLSAHSTRKVEGRLDAKRLVFLDDLIDTGLTFTRVDKELKKCLAPGWEWVGSFLYFQPDPLMNRSDVPLPAYVCHGPIEDTPYSYHKHFLRYIWR